jgi:DNA-binding PadR family transcriptional regulator
MIGVMALGEEAAGANIRSLHYKWLTSNVSETGIYSTLARLRDLGWARRGERLCTMIAWEHKRRSPVYRITEAGHRALVRYYMDAMWLGHVNARAHRGLVAEAESHLASIVARVRAYRKAA